MDVRTKAARTTSANPIIQTRPSTMQVREESARSRLTVTLKV